MYNYPKGPDIQTPLLHPLVYLLPLDTLVMALLQAYWWHDFAEGEFDFDGFSVSFSVVEVSIKALKQHKIQLEHGFFSMYAIFYRPG